MLKTKNNEWYQFSVWKEDHPERFPDKAFEFLRAFYYSTKDSIERWHYLFEPYVLVRFQAFGDYKATKHSEIARVARDLAETMGFKFEHGDIGKSSPSGRSGPTFYGEHVFYDTDEMWQANADLIDACARIGLIVGDNPAAFDRFAGKCVHLMCNQFGLNYKAEAKLLRQRAKRSEQLYKERGEQ